MRSLRLAFLFALLAVTPGCVVAGSTGPDYGYGYGYGSSGYSRPYYAPAPVYRPFPVYRPYYAPAPVYRPRYAPAPVYRPHYAPAPVHRPAPSRPGWVHRDREQRGEVRRHDGGRRGEQFGPGSGNARREMRNPYRQEQ